MSDLKSQQLSTKWRTSEEPRFVISAVTRTIASRVHIWRPPTDVYETEKAIVVRVEIAGMNNSEFTIALENRILSIRGVRLGPVEQRAYYQMEIHSGEFLSLVELPSPVEYDEIEAEYTDGFLQVVLPKAVAKQVEVIK